MPPAAERPGTASSPTQTVLAWLMANKRTLLYSASGIVALYVARCAYVASARAEAGPSRLTKLLRTLQDLTQALGSLSSISALMLTDLHAFLTSDADELPRSLRQLTKFANSDEVQQTLHRSAATLLRAVQGTVSAPAASQDVPAEPTALQQIIEAALSDRGRTLVGMAVGLATKNATSTLCEFLERMQQGGAGASAAVEDEQLRDARHAGGVGAVGPPSTLASIMDVLASEQGEQLITLLITKSIRTAVSTYVESTSGYNYYEDMVASIAKQEHREAVSDVMSRVTAAFCQELARAYRTLQQPASRHGNATPSHLHHHHQQQQQHGGLTPCLSHGSISSGAGVLPGQVLSQGQGALAASALHATLSAGALGHGVAAAAAAALHTTMNSTPTTAAVVAASGLGFGSRRHSYDDALALEQQKQKSAAVMAPQLPPMPRHALKQRQPSGSVVLQQVLGTPAASVSASSQVWLRPIIDLARERDVRSLALEVVSSATREATRSTWEALLLGGRRPGSESTSGPTGLLMQYHMYILLSLCVSLLMYALSPRVIALG